MQVVTVKNSVDNQKSINSELEIITLDVSGMRCAGCVKAVENQLLQQAGVISANVNLAMQIARVNVIPGATNPSELAANLTKNGFASTPRIAQKYTTPAENLHRQKQEIKQQLYQLLTAGTLILLSGISHLTALWQISWLDNIFFHWSLATLTLLGPGRNLWVDGAKALGRGAPNMNTLVGLGAIISYLASCIALLFPHLGWECFFDEPVMLLSFILLGRTLEAMARRRAGAAIEALISLQPPTARLIGQNQTVPETVEIPVESLRVGEWVQVLAGEKFPVDGEVMVGTSCVNESMLTGESLPVVKEPGCLVSAGTLNQGSPLVIRATHTGPETTLAQIVHLVEEALCRKAPVQKLADTVAGYFTYGIMALSGLTFLFWYFIGTQLWPNIVHAPVMAGHIHSIATTTPLLLSLKLAIAVLVIACPCSLGLATPTAILVGTGIGAERGLLIRGGDSLEKIHQIDTVVFDKTGTLTQGEMELTDYWTVSPALETSKLLQIAASVESQANHPLARAILQQARSLEIPLLGVDEFQEKAGFGVSAIIEQQLILLGTANWLSQHGVNPMPAEIIAQTYGEAGKTVVYVAAADSLIGLIACRDSLRPDALATVKQLQTLGINVQLLTGDSPEIASQVGRELGISPTDIQANIRPQAKAKAIAELQKQGRCVAMVGDGINDAPALAMADVGIALRSGTAVAVETAQVVLVKDCLHDVVESIQLSRQTWQKIQQNLFWAIIYNSIGIPVAAGVLLPGWGIAASPSAAGVFMALSSVSVVLNSLLLRSQKFIPTLK